LFDILKERLASTITVPSKSISHPLISTSPSFLNVPPIKIPFITPVTGSVSNRLADLLESDHFIWKEKKGRKEIQNDSILCFQE
jgi:hypothetical protein